jgi:hypothetical protein
MTGIADPPRPRQSVVQASAGQPSPVQATGSEGSHALARRRLEVDVLGEHPNDQVRPAGHTELLVETLEVGVDGMRRHLETPPDIVLRLGEILDDAGDDLKLSSRELQ